MEGLSIWTVLGGLGGLATFLGLIFVPLKALYKRFNTRLENLEHTVSDMYTKNETAELIDHKQQPVLDCVDRLNKTVEKLNETLKQLEIRNARNEGRLTPNNNNNRDT